MGKSRRSQPLPLTPSPAAQGLAGLTQAKLVSEPGTPRESGPVAKHSAGFASGVQ